MEMPEKPERSPKKTKRGEGKENKNKVDGKKVYM